MVVATQIRRYITSHGCTIKEFSKIAKVSEAVVRKWLYNNKEPSQRMLGKLINVDGFFNKDELKALALFNENDASYTKEIQGGTITLATLIAQKAETYSVKKNGDNTEVVFRISNEALNEPIRLDFSYSEIQKEIDKQHYVLQTEDIQHLKR